MTQYESPNQSSPNSGKEPELPAELPPGFTLAEWDDVRKHYNPTGPYFFGEQVLDHLKALEVERERIGRFNEEYMRAFLAGLAEKDPPHCYVRSLTSNEE